MNAESSQFMWKLHYRLKLTMCEIGSPRRCHCVQPLSLLLQESVSASENSHIFPRFEDFGHWLVSDHCIK